MFNASIDKSKVLVADSRILSNEFSDNRLKPISSNRSNIRDSIKDLERIRLIQNTLHHRQSLRDKTLENVPDLSVPVAGTNALVFSQHDRDEVFESTKITVDQISRRIIFKYHLKVTLKLPRNLILSKNLAILPLKITEYQLIELNDIPQDRDLPAFLLRKSQVSLHGPIFKKAHEVLLRV